MEEWHLTLQPFWSESTEEGNKKIREDNTIEGLARAVRERGIRILQRFIKSGKRVRETNVE